MFERGKDPKIAMGIGAKRCEKCGKILKDSKENLCPKCYNQCASENTDTKISFYREWSSAFEIEIGSYFDNRVLIYTSVTQLLSLILLISSLFIFGWYAFLLVPFIMFGWGKIFIYLPIYTRHFECDPPRYGFYFYGEGTIDSFWICKGRKTKCIYMPWAYDWVRTSALVKPSSVFTKSGAVKYNENEWIHETNKNRHSFYEDKWKGVLWSETYPYKYVLKSGQVQNILATVKVEEREWRPRWFKWTSLFKRVRKTIAVEFSSEVGEETGSWKGGTVGCGYNMLPDETPEETLRRMERERKF